MSIFENTISKMKNLPENELIKIKKFTRKHFQCCEIEVPDEVVGKFPGPMSREDFMRDIETAEQEIIDGKYSNAEEVFNGLEHRYGL